MITEGMMKQVQDHKNRGHQVVERGDGEFYCQSCDSWLAWQVVDTTGLSQANNIRLFVNLAMRYDSDGDQVDRILMDAGWRVVNDDNVDEAIEVVKKRLLEGFNPMPPPPIL